MSFFKNMFDTEDKSKSISRVEWRQLTDLGQLNEIITASAESPIIIFKHSTRCHISRMALKQFENEFDYHDAIIAYFLNILEYRDISNEIANRFGVVHQSPQLIIIKEGKAVYHTSHGDIDAAVLEQFI